MYLPQALRRRPHLRRRAAVLACAAITAGVLPLGAGASYAGGAGGGPVVLDGMDPVCHSEMGEATDGYIRTVLASIHAQTADSSRAGIAILGSDADTATCDTALGDMMTKYLAAITPAPVVTYYGTAGDIDSFFSAVAAHTVAPALVWIPDNGANNSAGSSVQTALTSHAGEIADFVNSGGGLFSNLGAYGWLSALLPGAVFNSGGCNGGPAVTDAGRAAFPDLTDDLVRSCWHGYFTGDTQTLVPLVDWPYPTNGPRVGVAIGGASVTLPSNFTAAAPEGAQRVGTTANVSVTVKDSQGQPAAEVAVSFHVDSGPDAGLSTTATTDSTGVATFAIAGAGAGTDVVSANATIAGAAKSASASVKWLPVPAPPSIDSLDDGDGTIDVTVNPASGDDAAEATDITVTLTPGGDSQTLPANGGQAHFANLTNGVTYTVAAATSNAVGSSSPAASTATPHPPYTVPAPPSIAGASTGSHTVTVTVDPSPSDGGSPITGYTVTAQPGNLTRHLEGSAGGEVTFENLDNGSSYTFTATATNVAGESDPPDEASATPSTLADAPTLADLVTGAGTLSVRVVPSAADGGAPVDRYTVVASPGSHISSVTPAGGRVTFRGLVNGTRYTVRAVAHNANGDSVSSPSLTATPLDRPAPPGTTAKAGSTSLTVRLKPADDGGSRIQSFRVSASAANLPTRTVTVPGDVRRVVVEGLRPKTSYRLSVVAINQVGASVPTSFTVRTLSAPKGVPMPQLAGLPIAPGVSATLVGDGVFRYGSAQLTAEGSRQLRGIAFGLRAADHIRCEGHTDFGGSARANLALSRARAAAVCNELRKDGVTAAATVVGRGGTEPVVRHGNRAERAQNRRVTVTFVD